MNYVSYVLLVLLAMGLAQRQASAVEQIEAWSYYPAAPFTTDETANTGLTSDLVAYLNQALAGQYEISYTLLPRARLNMMLENDEQAVVLFAPSVIFGGLNRGTYLWSEALFEDRQEILSRKDAPFELDGPASLVGQSIAAMRGHAYPQIACEVESGQIILHRAHNEGSLIGMLRLKHVDVITLPNSTISYFMKKDLSLKPLVHFSRNSLSTYTRHLMFQQGMENQRDDFNQVLLKMPTDPHWIEILQKYGLKPIIAE